MEEQERGVYLVVTYFCCTLVFIFLIGFFIQNPNWFKGISIFVLICLIALTVEFLIRRFMRLTYRDIGQFGTDARNMIGMGSALPPLAIAEPKAERAVKVEVVIPTVAELLKDGMLGTDSLLLGYTADGKPLFGSWNDVRTFAIAGKGRSGKTVTMFFLILQAILNECVVWVADPHFKKKSSITALLQPLRQWVRIANTDVEIADMTNDFIDTMEMRVSGESTDQTPMLLVTDEFTRMVESNERVYEAVVACAQQYAGFNGFAMIAGHEWTGNSRMLGKLRRALHAKFIHKLDEGYAKYLLNNSKYARTAEKLHTGWNYFQDAEGEIHELKTPLGTVQDAATIAARLKLLTGRDTPGEIALYDVPNLQLTPGETNGFNQAETHSFMAKSQVLSLPPAPETKDFGSFQGRKLEVARLRGLNFKQSEIIYQIWGARPGESQTYKDALTEYKRMIEELLIGA